MAKGPESNTDLDGPELPQAQPVEELSPKALPPTYTLKGTLVYEAEGRRLGQESYETSWEGDVLWLRAHGEFSVRVLFVTAKWTFVQEIAVDPLLRPRAYRLETRGPLGIGNQAVLAQVEGEAVKAAVGAQRLEGPVNPERALFAGTVSAYVLLPALYSLRASSEGLQLEVLGLGGEPGRRPRALAVTSLDMKFLRKEQWPDVGTVEVYAVRAGSLRAVLLARGEEFLALYSPGERTLRAYRTDLFPTGLETWPTP